MREVDYTTHTPDKINFVPPMELLEAWSHDYANMQANMIYGASLPFKQLIDRIRELNERFRQVKF
jgi:hypothetical protein